MTETIPAISLHQPWAQFLFTPISRNNPYMVKRHETRSFAFPPKHIGKEVAIHAAARHIRPGEVPRGLLAYVPPAPIYGAIIGTLVFTGCMSTNDFQTDSSLDELAGDWSPDRFAWAATQPRLLPTPYPFKGAQGWFSVPRADLNFQPE